MDLDSLFGTAKRELVVLLVGALFCAGMGAGYYLRGARCAELSGGIR
jgi:hypothetical protein